MINYDEEAFCGSAFSSDWKQVLRLYKTALECYGAKQKNYLVQAQALLETIPFSAERKGARGFGAQHAQLCLELQNRIKSLDSKDTAENSRNFASFIKWRLTALEFCKINAKFFRIILIASYIILSIANIWLDVERALAGIPESAQEPLSLIVATLLIVAFYLLPLLLATRHYAKAAGEKRTAGICLFLAIHHAVCVPFMVFEIISRVFG